jgi:hypothetical protein
MPEAAVGTKGFRCRGFEPGALRDGAPLAKEQRELGKAPVSMGGRPGARRPICMDPECVYNSCCCRRHAGWRTGTDRRLVADAPGRGNLELHGALATSYLGIRRSLQQEHNGMFKPKQGDGLCPMSTQTGKTRRSRS